MNGNMIALAAIIISLITFMYGIYSRKNSNKVANNDIPHIQVSLNNIRDDMIKILDRLDKIEAKMDAHLGWHKGKGDDL